MLKNYIKILFRNIGRNKVFTLINVFGLTLGITCSLVMFLIIKQELSYNTYHSNLDSIYRVGHIDNVDGREYNTGGVPRIMVTTMREELVGVKEVTLVSHERYGLISVPKPSGEFDYYEEDPELVFIEPNFFSVFDYTVLEGAIEERFSEPNVVALSKELAEKYFPGESAVGRFLRLNKSIDLQVIAVLENAPTNSDFPFGLFVSMQTKINREPGEFQRWNSIYSDDVAFLMLENGVSQEQIEAQFPDFVEKYWNKEQREISTYVLTPFKDYHFDERFGNFGQRSAPKNLLIVYAIIGAFLIVTACFNFINMSTAMAVKRSKEVGMRKVLGSSKKQLVLRFMGETFAITFISLVLSMGITERLMPLVINDFVGIYIPFNPLNDWALSLYLVSILVIVSFLAGFYPAMVLSRAKPINALKGTMSQGNGNLFLRRFLVFFQFLLCQLLIFGTIVALRQMDFFLSTDMGYDKEWIVNITLPENDKATQDLWESKIQNVPGIKSYSFNFRPPFSGSVSATNAYHYVTDSSRNELSTHIKMADKHYQETYGLRMLAGSWLSTTDSVKEFVVNEAFIRKLGIEDPMEAIGQRINVWGNTQPIVGVVSDYHTGRLDSRIEPVAMFSSRSSYRTLALRVTPANAKDIVSSMEQVWKEIHEEYEFDYSYMDETIQAYYESEQKMSQMLSVFAGIAIFIGCLGLYGLVSFMANQKAKEIGIRKVLGASVANLIRKFSSEFLVIVGIAFLLAAPIGYFGMNSWLQEYEYSISIGPMIFIASLIASVLIAIITTGYRSLKAATANPVQSLRDE